MSDQRRELARWTLAELRECYRFVLLHRYGRGRSRDHNLGQLGGSRAIREALASRLRVPPLEGLDLFMDSIGFKLRPHVLEREAAKRREFEAQLEREAEEGDR